MATKTNRILSYLPLTFRPAPQQSPLYALVDAFGNELLLAENSLAAVMQSHWVDRADRGAELIDDLQRLASLYGLAPRPDESVEEFREHLKRYIRTFLEGTVTVQGILRVTAEVLGLHIADGYSDLDTWWTRDPDTWADLAPRRDDGAELLFGVKSATARGSPAKSAQVVGTVDLSGGVDLRDAYLLQLQVDSTTIAVDFASNPGLDLQNLTLEQVVREINQASNPVLGEDIASPDSQLLKLTSPTVGTDSFLAVLVAENDAAEKLLGLAPWIYRGSDATPAQVTGTVDLSGNVDLSNLRYLRLALDSTRLAEIDCADPNGPAQTTLNHIRDAINTAFGSNIASHDGHFLTLTSPTTGSSSRIEFQVPAAQDATQQLFGLVAPVYSGQDAQPARMTSRRDLSGGANLSDRSQIQIGLNDSPSVTINCRGLDPANTRPGEIVAAIDNAFGGVTIASQLGAFLVLTSPTAGAAAQIVIETPPTSDGTAEILGLKPRQFAGTAATSAEIVGKQDLSQPVNLMARRFLHLSVDGSPPVEVDLQANVPDPQQATLEDLVEGINQVMGGEIADEDGQHLILRSPTSGSASQLAIAPQMVERQQRFLTRAFITDEATKAIFGFIAREERGTPATAAKVVGKLDLSRGVDLREKRYLRLVIDGAAGLDIDCAGKRPRATLISEVVGAINEAIEAAWGEDNLQVASTSKERYLVLTSPTAGRDSRIVFEPPRAEDALSRLGLEPGTFFGQEATQVRFVGTADLSGNVDLSTASHIKISIDGSDLLEIDCGGENPAATRIDEIVSKINADFGPGIASQDGQHLILTSEETGTDSQLHFETPDSGDATGILFGITPPRTYQGTDGTPARVRGSLNNPDLSVARFLKVAIDSQLAVEVDCAAQASDPTAVTLDEIVDAINEVLGDGTALPEGDYLILQSQQTGQAGRINLETFIAGDAQEVLFGQVAEATPSEEAAPATIAGEVDLLRPVDLSQRRLIRLAVDGSYPVEVDVAGAAPQATFLDEIIAAIDAVFPGMARATEDDRLQLTSPTAGENSSLALLPLRSLDLIEYPPQEKAGPPRSLSHGDQWAVNNRGVAEVFAEVEISATQGVVGPTLVNTTLGWRIRLLRSLRVGEKARLERDLHGGLQAKIVTADGSIYSVPGREILVGPIGSQTWVPFTGLRRLNQDAEGETTLQLNNPLANYLVRLGSQSGIAGYQITVAAIEADLSSLSNNARSQNSVARLVGRLQADGTSYHLVDGENHLVAQLGLGSDLNLAEYQDMVVAVEGQLYGDGDLPLLVVQGIAQLFDVTLNYDESGDRVVETYSGVTIGIAPTDPNSLVYQINSGANASTLVRGESLAKETVLTLPQGQTQWLYQDCYSSRFNYAHFNEDKFAGGLCADRGVFNISRFTSQPPPEPIAAVFAPSPLVAAVKVDVSFRWVSHQPGAFQVNLPLDLPARFGARFNQSYFSQGKGRSEVYEDTVTEPEDDPDYLVTRVANRSKLVIADKVGRVPLGWQAIEMPFRKPQFLTLGSETSPAQIYLTEKDLDGFIQLKANKNGAWGNQIAVAARPSGPALYDVSVTYEGARFENARQLVLGEPLPALTKEILKPGPVGILQAKAAGVRAAVSRDFNYVCGTE